MAFESDFSATGQPLPARYNPGMYRIGLIAMIVVLAGLQYRLWAGDGGWAEAHRLSGEIETIAAANADRQARNDALQAEIDDLKSGGSATEGRARADMGMVKQGERFFLTLDDSAVADVSAR